MGRSTFLSVAAMLLKYIWRLHLFPIFHLVVDDYILFSTILGRYKINKLLLLHNICEISQVYVNLIHLCIVNEQLTLKHSNFLIVLYLLLLRIIWSFFAVVIKFRRLYILRQVSQDMLDKFVEILNWTY